MKRTKQLLINLAMTSAMTLIAIPVIAAGPAPSGEAGMPSTPSASPGSSGGPSTTGPTLTDPAKSPIDFNSIDSNRDGNINVGEYLKQGGTRDSFRKSDKNGDNKLDSSELMAQ